jgi:hypothetical protein
VPASETNPVVEQLKNSRLFTTPSVCKSSKSEPQMNTDERK